MIEIVFTDSACGSLKLAQTFGKGEFHGGCIGVFVSHGDGSEPTQEEIDEATREAEEQQRQAWEQAVPMGGHACDVFGFSLGLSFGDIRDPLCSDDRMEAFKTLFSIWDPDLESEMRGQITQISADLETVRLRIAEGEDVRIWYSNIPDELCGFYWMMDELRCLPEGHGIIYAVKQPKYGESDSQIRAFNGWGGIEPGEFHKYTSLAVPVSDHMRRHYGNAWRDLRQENTRIRACINGQLCSAPENLYDLYIQKEIDAQPEEFRESTVVGNVLGKYHPGISDGYIHYRIDKQVRSGKLIAVTVPKEGSPGYWRILKKSQDQ